MTFSSKISKTQDDAEASAAFLEFLGDALGVFAFQVFDDDKDRKDPGRARTYIGTFDECRPALVAANRDRCGVYVTINDTNGKARRAVNVTHVRKQFVEIDGTHDPDGIKRIARGRCLNIAWMNESSPGKYHVYLNVADDIANDLEGFTLRQKQLAVAFDGGRESVDLSRVLRLPGFYHRKSDPFEVRVVYKDPDAHAHTLNDFDISLGDIKVAETQADEGVVEHEQDQVAIDRAIEHFKTFPAAISETPNGPKSKKGNNQTFDAGAYAKDYGVDEDTCLDLAWDFYNPRCKPEWSFEELRTIVRNVYAYTKSAQGARHPLGMAAADFGNDPINDNDVNAYIVAEMQQRLRNAKFKDSTSVSSGVVFTDADKVKTTNVVYIWKGRLARGKHSLIAGEAGEGKSQIGCYVAARVSRGEKWCDGETAPKGKVIILSAEDDPEDTLVPRLVAAGADLTQIKILKSIKDGKGVRKFNLESDIPQLTAACKALGNVVLIIIDPVSSYMGARIKGGDNTQVRAVLDPLSDLASELRCAIFSITHFRKGAEGAKAVHRIMDSIAFGAAPRATFGVWADPTEEGSGSNVQKRVFLLFKTNLPDKAKGLKYHIEETTGGTDSVTGKPIKTLKVVWDGATDMDADTVQRMENEKHTAPRLDEAIVFYRDALAAGPRVAGEVEAEAAKLGHKDGTLRRARDKLGLKARPRKGTAGPGQTPVWEYPALDGSSDFDD